MPVPNEENKEIGESSGSLEERVKALEDKMKEHQHLGNDGSNLLSENTELLGKSLVLSGAGAQLGDFIAVPFYMADSPQNLKEKRRASGIGTTVVGTKGATNEQINTFLVSCKLNAIDTNEPINKTDWEKTNEARVRVVHSPQVQGLASVNSYFSKLSFVIGEATPIVSGTGSLLSGGSTITDSSALFGTNDFYLGYINIQNSSGTLLETKRILSNTENVITIDGEWESSSGSYTYIIFMPIFLGSADKPWARLYVGEDIRLGYGASGGDTVQYIKWGSGGSPEGSMSGNPGSIYINTDGGDSATIYIKESGLVSTASARTGWIAK